MLMDAISNLKFVKKIFFSINRHMVRAAFPDLDCGYRSQTGGILKNLRESTSHRKCVDFHRKFYRPENLCAVIVGGAIEPEQVFEKIRPVEEAWIKKHKGVTLICNIN